MQASFSDCARHFIYDISPDVILFLIVLVCVAYNGMWYQARVQALETSLMKMEEEVLELTASWNEMEEEVKELTTSLTNSNRYGGQRLMGCSRAPSQYSQ